MAIYLSLDKHQLLLSPVLHIPARVSTNRKLSLFWSEPFSFWILVNRYGLPCLLSSGRPSNQVRQELLVFGLPSWWAVLYSVLDYSVPHFTHIWTLWLVLIDSLYYFIGILFTFPQWQKRANFLTFQADEPLCHLEALWLLDKKQWHNISGYPRHE